MRVNWDNYSNQRGLIEYYAFSYISWDRWTRLNKYFHERNERTLKLQDPPEGFETCLYGGLVFKDGETYLEYLERINLIQENSQLLPITPELRTMVSTLLKCDVTEASSTTIDEPDLPIIISGDIRLVEAAALENQIYVNIDVQAGGVYIPVLNLIIIDLNLISHSANAYPWFTQGEVELREPNFSAIYEIVLRHEIGHWMHHEYLLNSSHFEDDQFMNLTQEVHEFWAQVIAYHLLDSIDSNYDYADFMNYFSEGLPEVYKLYMRPELCLSDMQLSRLFQSRGIIQNLQDLEYEINNLYLN